jgi:hypothetical protein
MNTYSHRQQILSFATGLAWAGFYASASLLLSEHRQRNMPELKQLIAHPMAAIWNIIAYRYS